MKKIFFLFWIFTISFCTATMGQSYTIPVVVHNMHNNGQGYLTDQKIIDLIQDINDYYDDYTPRFHFKLAMLSPDGYCGLAINHVQTTQPYGSIDNVSIDVQLKNLIRWPNNQYLNIWTVVDIDNDNYAGYAYTPCSVIETTDPPSFNCLNTSNQSSWENVRDGVVIKYDEPVEYLAHEIAHWLNLFHTNGPDGFSSNSNWLSCHGPADNLTQGDFVADTPPVDYLNQGNGPNSCTLDVPDLPDDLNNLMTNITAAISINSTLTPGQLARMEECIQTIRTNISSFSNLEATGVSPISITSDNPIISGNTTWSFSNTPAIVDIIGDLTVEEGVSFTVEGITLRFCEGGRLIVKKGGSLRLKGKLTSIGNNKWQGVEFLDVPPGYAYYTYFLSMDNATIENAKTGIKTLGAQILATDLTFSNCDIAIDAHSFNDENAPVSTYAVNFINNNNPDFHTFIRLNRWDGAYIKNSVFTSNSTSSCIEEHGIGIDAENSFFKVDNDCKFNNMGYGVKVTSGTGEKPFYVWNSSFNGCYRGIYSNSVGNFKIWKNVFDNAGIATSNISSCTGQDEMIENQVGVYLEGHMFGADIQENEFMNASVLTAVNIFADDLGPINNKIRNNIFNSPYGIVGDNLNSTVFPPGNSVFKRGLYFTCNDFFSNQTAVWAIDPHMLSARQIQFHMDANMQLATARNRWLNGNANDIINDYLLGTDIEYYHSNQGFDEPSEIVNVVNNLVNDYTCASEITTPIDPDPTSSSGPGTIIPEPPVGPNPPVITPVLTDLIVRQINVENQINNIEPGLGGPSTSVIELQGTGLWEVNDELIADILATYQLFPAVWSENDYISYLLKLNNIVGDYTLFKYYVGKENWTQATITLNNIPSKYYMNSYQVADYNDLVNMYGIINGTSLTNLSTTQTNALIIIAEGVKGTARHWSRSILTMYDHHYTSTFDLPLDKARSTRYNGKADQNTDLDISIYPNPSSDRINIKYNGEPTFNTIVVETITGVEVLRIPSPSIDMKSIDISTLNNGVYIMKFKNRHDVISVHKFIKI